MSIEIKPLIKMDVNSLGENPLKVYLLAILAAVASLIIIGFIMKRLEEGYKIPTSKVRSIYGMTIMPLIMSFFMSHPALNPLVEIINRQEMSIRTAFTFLFPSTIMYLGLSMIVSIVPLMGSVLLDKYIERKFNRETSGWIELLSFAVWVLATIALVKATPQIMPIFMAQ